MSSLKVITRYLNMERELKDIHLPQTTIKIDKCFNTLQSAGIQQSVSKFKFH